MSGKYIPPSRRNVVTSIKDQDFPALSTNTRTIAPTKSTVSFSALASEWNEKDRDDEMERKSREDIERSRAERAEADSRRFVAVRRDYDNPEPYVYPVDQDDNCVLINDKHPSDEWKTVNKRLRKQWSYEEQIERKQKFEEAEARMYGDSSVWNSGDHPSEEWSHRDRRIL
jgi:epoxyqueuosine reductase QueG